MANVCSMHAVVNTNTHLARHTPLTHFVYSLCTAANHSFLEMKLALSNGRAKRPVPLSTFPRTRVCVPGLVLRPIMLDSRSQQWQQPDDASLISDVMQYCVPCLLLHSNDLTPPVRCRAIQDSTFRWVSTFKN